MSKERLELRLPRILDFRSWAFRTTLEIAGFDLGELDSETFSLLELAHLGPPGSGAGVIANLSESSGQTPNGWLMGESRIDLAMEVARTPSEGTMRMEILCDGVQSYSFSYRQ